MRYRIWKRIGRGAPIVGAFLLLGLVAVYDHGNVVTPRTAAAQTVAAPATRLAAAATTQRPAASKPRIGGTLTFGIVKDIGTPIPFVAYTSTSQYVKDNVYEPLVMFDHKGDIHPWLAESWAPNANSTEWTFKIRRGVKFHDGKELTANDVVWSAKHIMDPANGAAGQGQLSSNVRDVVAVDKHTVKFILPGPRGLLPELFADTAILHVEQEMQAKEKVPSLHAVARMWEIQPKQVYTVYGVKESTIKEKPAALQAFVKAVMEATRIMYSDKAKVLPIMVKHTGYPEKIVSETYNFLVKSCIWDANSGLSPERVNFTANLMTKVGNIEKGKAPNYDQIVDKEFATKAIKDLGEWKGPVCPTAAF